MPDDTLQRLFQNLQGVKRQQSLTGNYQAGYPQNYAPYDAYFSNARQQAKEGRGLALQEKQLALNERQLTTQTSLYNKALGQQERMGWLNLGANVAGTAGGLLVKNQATNKMAEMYGQRPALTGANDFKMTTDLLHPTTEGQYMLPAATRMPDPNAITYDTRNMDMGSKGALFYDPATMGGEIAAPSIWDNWFAGDFWNQFI